MNQQWNPFPALDPDAAHGDREVNKLAKGLNKRIEQLLQSRAEIDAAQLAILQAGPEVAVREPAIELSENRHYCLVGEATLRRDLVEFYKAEQAAYQKAAGQAAEEFESVQQEVRRSLVQIGYCDGPLPGTLRESILPGHIAQHPKVFAAKLRFDALFAMVHERDRANANAQSLKAVEAQLQESRARLLQA